jgi:hypothetical protein
MNLKILALLITYWIFIGLFFFFGGSYLVGYSNTGDISSMANTTYSASEQADAGLFTTGLSFGRFFGLMLFGIGLPADTPAWFSVLFMMWQSFITIFTAGFLISSLWNG